MSRPPDDYGAGCPRWMDPEGTYGKVIVLLLKPINEGMLPKNHPFIVGKSIKLMIGDAYTATTEAKGTKYVIKVRNQIHATKLLDMKKLFDGTPIEITVHPTLNYSRCIVNCPEVCEMTKEEILEELAPQGVTDIRRFTRIVDKVRINTPTMVLTMEGTTWPQYIYFGALRVPTRMYFPTPMLCYNCIEYGHTKNNCKNAPRCQNCSSHGHMTQDCNEATYCLHCKQEHRSTSPTCPIYKRENEIVRIKVEKGLSFAEAKKLYNSRFSEKSYANVSKRLVVEQDNKDREIFSLKEEITALRNQLAAMIAEFKKVPNCQCQKTDGEKVKQKESRNKRLKEVSPEITTGSDFRPPPLKKATAETTLNAESVPKMQSSTSTVPEGLLSTGSLEAAISETNTENMSVTDDSECDTIVIKRKGKKKHHQSNNDAHIQHSH